MAELPRPARNPFRGGVSTRLRRAAGKGENPTGPLPKPAWFEGPETEWMVWWALERMGKKNNIDFSYQNPLFGGRQGLGGAVVDFVMYNPPGIGINPHGRFWHYEQGAHKLANDIAQKAALLGRGILVIAIDEDDLRRDPMFYVEAALRGIDYSDQAVGFN